MYNSPHQIYKQSSVQTANGGQLIIMLYDGAIRFTKAGIEGIHTRDYGKTNNNLKKAQAIIHELIASLDYEYEISNNLKQIYEYLLHQLIQSNMKKDSSLASEVIIHLEELREVWKQIIKGNASMVTHAETGV
ncbi:flagellar export chaperone FliS [Paenibacillus paeoniae]|uniref:Flagellar secretion chaperone FliS n=1 Tax=Paenibacillus paeoniae TaxID=2292705 RepID=A0A371P0U5_9BACL|nr:flagellar export chaperone FliS [Paenibacillus paeoniae]REK69569.1 flagellar export chaperone FliS [Paenibacillus paeoniae]